MMMDREERGKGWEWGRGYLSRIEGDDGMVIARLPCLSWCSWLCSGQA